MQRLFAQEGTCFSDYLRDARLQRAHAMLADPRHSRRRVLEIAFDCGFADITTFNRTFRQRYGVAPTQVRP
ncbi:DNA-binding transcriptional activator FeaR [compost metagenome]